jgi:hypothetical protein
VRVLVACEYSGKVREAFRSHGHDAWSCDLLPADDASPYHYQCDVRDVLGLKWDMLIGHPPCTYLAVSGARWLYDADGTPNADRHRNQAEAVAFVQELWGAPIPHIALENPVSMLSSLFRKPDQIIQPWMFGHGETKTTCLWLKHLPPLFPTWIAEGREQRIFRLPPSADRWKLRSETFQGIADAMAAQWGSVTLELETA